MKVCSNYRIGLGLNNLPVNCRPWTSWMQGQVHSISPLTGQSSFLTLGLSMVSSFFSFSNGKKRTEYACNCCFSFSD